jgi:molecular chaperone DnaK
MGSVMTRLIERNTTIPTSKSQVFSTAADSQTSVEIHILQGERPMAIDNKSLGRFLLDGIPPAPRGIPQIEVTFDIDANGILNVKAKDKATNKEQHITITGSTNMSDAEIEKMRKEAEKYAEEDKKKKEAVETRNKAESLVLQAERTLKDAGDKVSEDIKKPVTEKIDALKKLLESKDSAGAPNAKPEDLQKGYDELSEVIQKVGAEMYKAAEPRGAQGTATGAEEGHEGAPHGAGTAEDDGTKVYEAGKKKIPEEGPEAATEGEVVDKK